jgi:hypothetical protein
VSVRDIGHLFQVFKEKALMGWQSGTFHRLYSWNSDANAGLDILAPRMDSDTDDIANGISNCIARDGQNVPLANLSMGGFKHTGVAQASNPTDYARFDQVLLNTGNQTINGNLTTTGTLTVTGGTTLSGAASLNGGANITGGATIDALAVSGNTTLNGAATLHGGATISGGATIDQLSVTGPAGVGGNLNVNGAASVVGGLTSGGLVVNGGSSLTGMATLSGGANITGGTTTDQLSVTGPASIGGNLNVNGAASVVGGLTSGGLTVNGGATVNGPLVGAVDRIISVGTNAPSLAVYNSTAGAGSCLWIGTGGLNFGLADSTGTPTTAWGYFDASGNFNLDFGLNVTGYASLNGGLRVQNGDLNVYGNAYKPGGGAWGDTASDVRLKQNITDYSAGLSAIRRLRPVSYQFNGLGDTTADGKTYYGLVAQDVVDIMPEMVSQRLTERRGEPVSSYYYTLDATPLLYALVNGLKEVVERLEALEIRT